MLKWTEKSLCNIPPGTDALDSLQVTNFIFVIFPIPWGEHTYTIVQSTKSPNCQMLNIEVLYGVKTNIPPWDIFSQHGLSSSPSQNKLTLPPKGPPCFWPCFMTTPVSDGGVTFRQKEWLADGGSGLLGLPLHHAASMPQVLGPKNPARNCSAPYTGWPD